MDRKNRTTRKAKIVGCSDGSVYDSMIGGGYAWGLYERQQNCTLTNIGVTGIGRETAAGLEVNSVHSYRVEAMGILAGLTFLRERKWRGSIEWHTDCLGAINTREKIKHHKYNH